MDRTSTPQSIWTMTAQQLSWRLRAVLACAALLAFLLACGIFRRSPSLRTFREDLPRHRCSRRTGRLDDARRMRDALIEKGYVPGSELRFVEDPRGHHNEVDWGRRFTDAVMFLLK